jgi:hypothetical protein
MGIVTAKNGSKSALRGQLERAQAQVTYDVDQGLARHRALVAQGAPLPVWAAQTGSVARSIWRGRLLGGVSVLLVGGAALYASRPPSVAPATAPEMAPSAATSAVSSAPVVVPVMRVEPTVEAIVPTEPVVEPLVPAQKLAPPIVATPVSAQLRAERTRGGARSGPERVATPVSVAPELPRDADSNERTPEVDPATLAPVEQPLPAVSVRPASVPVAPVAAVPWRAGTSAAAGAPPQLAPASVSESHAAAPARPSRVPRIEAERAEVVEEMEELTRAESVLASAPAVALSRVRASIAAHPQGILVQERRYVEIMALIALGRIADARPLASTFLRSYPQGPYRRRVETALGDVEASR